MCKMQAKLTKLYVMLENAGTAPYKTIANAKELVGEIIKSDKAADAAPVDVDLMDKVPLPLRRIEASLYDSTTYRRKDVGSLLLTRPREIFTSGFRFPGDSGEKYEIRSEDVFSEEVVNLIRKSII